MIRRAPAPRGPARRAAPIAPTALAVSAVAAVALAVGGPGARAASHDDDASAAVAAEAGDEDDDDAPTAAANGFSGPLGPAGVFTGGATELPALTLSVVEPLASGPYTLDSGSYYRIDVVADGSGELALSGAEFFRSVWVDEVVIEDIEVRPLGLDSLEFDAAGTATVSFVAIRPGTYTLSIPGSSGESQRATFTIR